VTNLDPAHGLERVRGHHLIGGEHTNLAAMTHTVEEDMGGEAPQEGIHTGHTPVHVPGRLFGEATDHHHRGDGHPAMNVVGLVTREVGEGRDREAIRYGRVGHELGLSRVLAQGRGHIRRTLATAAEAGQGQAAEAGGVLVILGIVDRDLHDHIFVFLGSQREGNAFQPKTFSN